MQNYKMRSSKNDCSRIFLRRGSRTTRLKHIRSTDIRNRIVQHKTTLGKIEKRRLVWYGHVQRMNMERLRKQLIIWNPPDKRKGEDLHKREKAS